MGEGEQGPRKQHRGVPNPDTVNNTWTVAAAGLLPSQEYIKSGETVELVRPWVGKSTTDDSGID